MRMPHSARNILGLLILHAPMNTKCLHLTRQELGALPDGYGSSYPMNDRTLTNALKWLEKNGCVLITPYIKGWQRYYDYRLVENEHYEWVLRHLLTNYELQPRNQVEQQILEKEEEEARKHWPGYKSEEKIRLEENARLRREHMKKMFGDKLYK